MNNIKVSLGEICKVDWGNTSLTKSAYIDNGKHLAVSAKGEDGRIDHWEHDALTPVISAIGAQCGKLFLPKEKFTAIKNTITLTPIKKNKTINPYCPQFLYFLLSSVQLPRRGAGQPFISKGDLEKFEIALPPLEEQRRIAAILDKKEYLKKLISHQESLYRAAEISIFYEEFGSPISNPFKWPNTALSEIADIFSDGPFGSNLKSSHYTDTGIRVVRLQNIGIGKFIDDDKSFISESHYETIKKHSCLPGDILIGTLGDPNLRACTLPRTISIAINKADCIQMRCKETLCMKEFIVQLLNLPATNKMASSLILGQTRGRISMGRLKTFEIPLPPLERQAKFVQKINLLRQLQIKNQLSMETVSKGIKGYSSKIFSFRAHQ